MKIDHEAARAGTIFVRLSFSGDQIVSTSQYIIHSDSPSKEPGGALLKASLRTRSRTTRAGLVRGRCASHSDGSFSGSTFRLSFRPSRNTSLLLATPGIDGMTTSLERIRQLISLPLAVKTLMMRSRTEHPSTCLIEKLCSIPGLVPKLSRGCCKVRQRTCARGLEEPQEIRAQGKPDSRKAAWGVANPGAALVFRAKLRTHQISPHDGHSLWPFETKCPRGSEFNRICFAKISETTGERMKSSRATWSIKTTGLRSCKTTVAKIRAALSLVDDHAARILIIGPEDQPMPLQDHGATINTDSDLARRRFEIVARKRRDYHLNFIRKFCEPRSPKRAPPLSMRFSSRL